MSCLQFCVSWLIPTIMDHADSAGTCTQGWHEVSDLCMARSSFRYGQAFLTNRPSVHPGFTTTRQILVNLVGCHRNRLSYLQPGLARQRQKLLSCQACAGSSGGVGSGSSPEKCKIVRLLRVRMQHSQQLWNIEKELVWLSANCRYGLPFDVVLLSVVLAASFKATWSQEKLRQACASLMVDAGFL